MDLLKQYSPFIVAIACGLLSVIPESARKWLIDLVIKRKPDSERIELPLPDPDERDHLLSLCEIIDAARDAGDEELAKGLESFMVDVSHLQEVQR